MREIEFYRTRSGNCPVEDFLDSLTDKQVEKILWVLRIIRDVDIIPKEYLKKLIGTAELWEIRIKSGNNHYRILCFIRKGRNIVLTNGFSKKSQKVPSKEIKLAQERKKDYFERIK
jgi:phage-related protein